MKSLLIQDLAKERREVPDEDGSGSVAVSLSALSRFHFQLEDARVEFGARFARSTAALGEAKESIDFVLSAYYKKALKARKALEDATKKGVALASKDNPDHQRIREVSF